MSNINAETFVEMCRADSVGDEVVVAQGPCGPVGTLVVGRGGRIDLILEDARQGYPSKFEGVNHVLFGDMSDLIYECTAGDCGAGSTHNTSWGCDPQRCDNAAKGCICCSVCCGCESPLK